MRRTSHGKGACRLEVPLAVAKQHRHRVIAVVGGDDVGPAIAVDIRHRHRMGFIAHGKGLGATGRLPSPLPSNTDTVLSPGLAGDDVGQAIARGPPPPPHTAYPWTGLISRGECPGRLKAAVAVAQQHLHRAVAGSWR